MFSSARSCERKARASATALRWIYSLPLLRGVQGVRKVKNPTTRERTKGTMSELRELFLDELADIYNAEGQLLKALPKMAKAAQTDSLREAFEMHAQETEQQIERLKQVFEIFGKPAKGKTCEAMKGLIEEGQSMMKEFKGSAALDAALISAAQKVEHYEIATYGCLCTWAELLEENEALDLLKETMEEEETTDEKLTDLAEECINEEALGGGEEEEEEEEEAPQARGKAKTPARR